ASSTMFGLHHRVWDARGWRWSARCSETGQIDRQRLGGTHSLKHSATRLAMSARKACSPTSLNISTAEPVRGSSGPIQYDAGVFELRRDPVTGWWSAIVTDRSFEHSSFAVEALPVEGSHCRHCDEAPPEDDDRIRRVTLRTDAFHRIDPAKDQAAQMAMSEVEASSGSWEILVGPRGHHESLAEARPQLAVNLLRGLRDTMREIGEQPLAEGEQRYVQAVQSYGRQAGSRSQHLNLELYAIPQIPHWVAEEIGGGARHMISRR